MSDDVEYLPDNYTIPLDDKLARRQEVQAERRAKLSPLQAIFVNHFLEANMDVAAAAQRTGIKTELARSWIEHEGPVSELIGLRLQEIAQRSKVTVDVIVQGLYDEATRMPINDEDKTVSHAARVSAWSHLAKFKGMFDKGNKGQSSKITVNINTGR